MTFHLRPTRRWFLWLLLLCTVNFAHASQDVRELEWDDLIPPDWNPFALLDALLKENPDGLQDGSPEADRLLREFVTAGANAPVVQELDGQAVRLPGYVVPLDFENESVSEFLLVPYFGACIHVPPPPANQIVYVKTDANYSPGGLFDVVWVTGTLHAEAFDNEVGDAGYTMLATTVEPFE